MEERELELPELPEPTLLGAEVTGRTADFYGHTDEAMRAYGAECARQAVLAERERAANTATEVGK